MDMSDHENKDICEKAQVTTKVPINTSIEQTLAMRS